MNMDSLLILYQRQSLLDKIVALAQLVDRLVDEIACDLVKIVCEVVQLFGVMAVVIQHVLQKSKGFFW